MKWFRSTLFAVLATATVLGATPALGQKIIVGVSPTAQFVPVMVAKDKGIFQRNGLDVDVTLLQSGAQTPVALQSGSIQVGSMSAPALLQSVDSGLDMVVIAGGGLARKTDKNYAVIAAPNSNITSPADFAGKRVAVDGIGSFFYVLFREWLTVNKVDYKGLKLTETPHPTMGDVLRSGNVDAVMTSDPFLARIIEAKTHGKIFYMAEDMPDSIAPFIYAASGAWARSKPAEVAAFRRSIAEAMNIVNTDPDAAKESYGKFVKVPPAAIAAIKFNYLDPATGPASLQPWIEIMTRQGALRSPIVASKLFLN